MLVTYNGMAVLVVRFAFVLMSFQVMRKVNWRTLFTDENYYAARYVYIIVSIALGHLAGSFFITIIEILQQMLWSSFLN